MLTIEKTFSEMADSSTKEMRHPDPKKSHLRVVEVSSHQSQTFLQLTKQTYDILPDAETWANNYYLIKFPERPGAAVSHRHASQS
jgi:RNA polymerase II-associated factor 1